MLAYRLVQAQTQPEFQEVSEPHAGPRWHAPAADGGATDSSRIAPVTAGV